MTDSIPDYDADVFIPDLLADQLVGDDSIFVREAVDLIPDGDADAIILESEAVWYRMAATEMELCVHAPCFSAPAPSCSWQAMGAPVASFLISQKVLGVAGCSRLQRQLPDEPSVQHTHAALTLSYHTLPYFTSPYLTTQTESKRIWAPGGVNGGGEAVDSV